MVPPKVRSFLQSANPLLTPQNELVSAFMEEYQFLRSKIPPSPVRRRLWVRMATAQLEGLASLCRQYCLALAQFDCIVPGVTIPSLSVAEQVLLREEQFSTDGTSAKTVRRTSGSSVDLVLFSMAMFMRSMAVNIQFNKGAYPAQLVVKSFIVRNRLAHPRNAQDLTVSDNESKDMDRAYGWYLDMFMAAHLQMVVYALQNLGATLQKRLNDSIEKTGRSKLNIGGAVEAKRGKGGKGKKGGKGGGTSGGGRSA